MDLRARHLAVGLAGVALASALTLTPTASADPPYDTSPANNAEFCQSLATVGYPMDCGYAVAMALGQCGHFASGKTWQDAIRTTVQMTGDRGLAGYMLGGAVSFYCPQYVGQLPANAQAAYDGS